MEQRLLPSLKEIRPHGTEGFPCAVYQTHAVQKGILVKHHWHDEVEILYFFGGNFRLEINMESFPVTGECMFFINPGELHSIFAEKILSSGEDAVVFHPGLLGFDAYDAVQMQLIQPIQNKKLLFPRCLMPEHPAFVPVRDAFAGILHAFGRQLIDESPSENGVVTDDLASQLRIKSSLLSIFALLTAHQLFTPTEKHSDKRVERIKATLAYIKENYKDKIYIRDLAEVVNMNEQYFCRFFRKMTGKTPITYLNDYRVGHAAEALLQSDARIVEICYENGFENVSYFIRKFKEGKGMTPKEYRLGNMKL